MYFKRDKFQRIRYEYYIILQIISIECLYDIKVIYELKHEDWRGNSKKERKNYSRDGRSLDK